MADPFEEVPPGVGGVGKQGLPGEAHRVTEKAK